MQAMGRTVPTFSSEGIALEVMAFFLVCLEYWHSAFSESHFCTAYQILQRRLYVSQGWSLLKGVCIECFQVNFVPLLTTLFGVVLQVFT